MNKIMDKPMAKWLVPIVLLLVHIFYIPKLAAYNMQVLLHWGCYLLLFLYLSGAGEIRIMGREFRRSIGKLNFLAKVLITFCVAFVSAMLIVYFFAKDLYMMYPVWQPLSIAGLVIWAFAYVFLQPLVDNIIYHKWMLGDGTGSAKILVIVVAMIRTFLETGIIIYSKNSEIPQESFLALALWLASVIFACAYVMFKNAALTYTSEVLYRIALVITIFIGMPQFYIPV